MYGNKTVSAVLLSPVRALDLIVRGESRRNLAWTNEFESAVADALVHFPGYEFDCGTKVDPDCKQYLEVLYPSEEDRQTIENRVVLEVLERKGDTLKTPRDIFHWIYFRTKNHRDAFSSAIRLLEYRLKSQPNKHGDVFPFGLCIVKFQSVKQDGVDEAVIELFRRVKEFNGDYDGWDTEVISEKKGLS